MLVCGGGVLCPAALPLIAAAAAGLTLSTDCEVRAVGPGCFFPFLTAPVLGRGNC
jgi:hypothetical protein